MFPSRLAMMDFITASATHAESMELLSVNPTRPVPDYVHGENDQRNNKSTAGSRSHSWSCSVLADDSVIHGG